MAPRPRRALREVLVYGLCGGAVMAVLKVAEYRFLVVERSVEVYAGVIAALFAGLGIWLGLTMTRRMPREPETTTQPLPGGPAFAPDADRVRELGITPRELEILGLVAAGLSNREIADRLFVSENTVKTHCSRLLDKLGAKRRTQAVQIARTRGLIP